MKAVATREEVEGFCQMRVITHRKSELRLVDLFYLLVVVLLFAVDSQQLQEGATPDVILRRDAIHLRALLGRETVHIEFEVFKVQR